jgi:hypothetical protein
VTRTTNPYAKNSSWRVLFDSPMETGLGLTVRVWKFMATERSFWMINTKD